MASLALVPQRTLGDVLALHTDAQIRHDALDARYQRIATVRGSQEENDLGDQMAALDDLMHGLRKECEAMVLRLTGHSFAAIERVLN